MNDECKASGVTIQRPLASSCIWMAGTVGGAWVKGSSRRRSRTSKHTGSYSTHVGKLLGPALENKCYREKETDTRTDQPFVTFGTAFLKICDLPSFCYSSLRVFMFLTGETRMVEYWK